MVSTGLFLKATLKFLRDTCKHHLVCSMCKFSGTSLYYCICSLEYCITNESKCMLATVHYKHLSVLYSLINTSACYIA